MSKQAMTEKIGPRKVWTYPPEDPKSYCIPTFSIKDDLECMTARLHLIEVLESLNILANSTEECIEKIKIVYAGCGEINRYLDNVNNAK